jgi:hypothetical protein
MDNIMTKAKLVSLKSAKANTKKAVTIIQPKHIEYASEAGRQALGFMTYKDQLASVISLLNKDKVIIGDARKCESAQAFLITRFEGKTPSAAGKAKALGAFRYSVQTGKPYDENRERKAKKTKAKSGAIMISIPANATIDQIAGALNKGFGKLATYDCAANMVALLTDAMIEAGFDPLDDISLD